jgi:hypothetical protein
MNLTHSPRLTDEQVATFRREGYLIPKEQVFPADKFQVLKAYFEKMLAELPADVRPESMDVPHYSYPDLFRWLFDDAVLDLVEPIIGPDIALFSSHFICKPRGNGKRVPWHEDSAYWRNQLTPMEVVTVWLAIDPSKQLNGCMWVIPQTHDNGFSDYDPVDTEKNVFPTEIKASQRDTSKAVPCELEAGQASLHDGRIMHGSEPNTSAMRRCGYTMRYISTRTRFNHEKHGEYHHLYLARGKDHAGNIYADPSKSYEHLARYRIKHGKTGH